MKAKRIVSMLLVAVMLIGMLPGTVFAEEALENVALGKTVTASSSYNELYTPDKLVDGNLVDDIGRWNSQGTQGAEWVLIDLEGLYDVSQIHLEWWSFGNVAGTLQVDVSADGKEYETVGQVTDNINVAFNTFDMNPAKTVRFVKFYFDNAPSTWGYSLKEIQVFGKANAQYSNVALGKQATASSSYNELYTPDKALDGDVTTDAGRWNSMATTDEQWLLVDLGAAYSIHEIRMFWLDWGTVAGAVDLYASLDDITYETVKTIRDNINVAENILLLDTPVEARYLKVVMNQTPGVFGYCMKELEAYGVPAKLEEDPQLPLKNLAIGSTATASSSYNELYTPNKVVDGDVTTDAGRWNSQATTGEQWLQIDLGKVYPVTRISMKIWLDLNLANHVSFLGSEDGVVFKEIKTYTNQPQLSYELNMAKPINLQYLKVVFNGCVTEWGYSVAELEVYSKDYLQPQSLADHKKVYTGEIFNDNYVHDIEAYYVTDGNYTTRWSSCLNVDNPPCTPMEAWLMIDLEKVTDLEDVVIFWNDVIVYAKDLSVLTSVDGVAFTEAVRVQTESYVQQQRIALPEGTQARYVKFAFHVPSSQFGYSIQEVQIHGFYTDKVGTNLDCHEAEFATYTGGMVLAQSDLASGGWYAAGIDYRDSATFHYVSRAANLQVTYRAQNACTIDVYVEGHLVATVDCPATPEGQFGTASADVFIAAGSSVKLVPSKAIDLDRVDWNAQAQHEKPENVLLAKDGILTGATIVNDYSLSKYGDVVRMEDQTSVGFENLDAAQYNTLAVRYVAEQNTVIRVQVAGGADQMFTLPAATYFNTAYLRLDSAIGATALLSASGTVVVDTLTLMDTNRAESVDVSFSGETRSQILLDGIWECTSGSYEDTVVPVLFDKTIPVPGLWDLADIDMGPDEGKSLWYQKTINLTEPVPDGQRVMLRINKAYYGRTVYVNGVQVGQYYYNNTASEMDIADYLQVGENKIQIKLGTYDSGRVDPNNPAHMGYDLERINYWPGLVDSVSLIINSDPYVERVQTAPDLDNGTLRVVTQLKNDTAADIRTDVTFKIYELGVYENRVPAMNQLVQTVVLPDQLIAAGGALDLDKIITITGFNKEEKAWRPGNPYLYRLVIETSGDVMEHRFGMRTFVLDQESGKSLLNGEQYYLRGTNILINRFYEDPKREDHPWDEEWVRQLFAEFQAVNWEGGRFCIGFPPEFWYDLCDEIGFMVVDEYPYWYCSDYDGIGDKCTVEELTPEYITWIYERNNHPCVIFWDAQNESNGAYDLPLNAAVIANVRGIDIQGRAWENGWGPVQSPGDACEQHNYPFINLRFTLDHIGTDAFYYQDNADTQFDYINEYGWLWVDRNGNPCLHSAAGYALGKRGTTNEERLGFYATAIAQMTERWRASRKYMGIFQFCGITYSYDDGTGFTSDVLNPDLSTPIIRDEQKWRMRSAFAPVGIVIENYSTKGMPGEERTIPVVLVNDLNEAVSKEVTVSLYKNHKASEQELISSQTRTISADALQVSAMENFLFTMPQEEGKYSVVASYAVEGEDPIVSVRYFELMENADAELDMIPEDSVADNGVVTETIRFDEGDESKLNFYHSANGGFAVENGKLVTTGETGEFKAMLKDAKRVNYAAVTINPGQIINGGIYLHASNPADAQDAINAMTVMVQSNFSGWLRAESRVDIVIGEYPTWKEHFRLISEEGRGNSLFLGSLKEPLRLEVWVNNNVLDVKLSLVSDPSAFVTASYEYVGAGDLSIGTAGLRSQHADNSFDNFTVQYLPVSTTTVVGEHAVWDFSDAQQAWDFLFYQSGTNGMSVADGTLGASGTNGENKVILDASLENIKEVSVDIIPGESGLINSGLYLGVTDAQSGQDQINALSIGIEAVYTEGDAANRLDLVVGSFPTWTEHLRVVSETGRSNALFTDGQKQPVNLRVTMEDNLLYITVSLISDPTQCITGVYSVPEGTDLTCGYIGMRSQHSEARFDNFTVITEKQDAVAQVGETTYATVTEAVANAGGQVVTILADTDEAITVSADVIIDLAGKSLGNIIVAEGAKLTLIDTATDDYEGVYGSATVTGSVETIPEVDGKTYLVVSENGVYSAHRYDVALTHISLNPAKDALGYKAKLYGDEVVLSRAQSVGFNLWVDGGKVLTRTIQGKQEFTLRLNNILKNNGGEMNINATAFVTFAVGEESHTETTGQQTTTMKETLQAVDRAWETYSKAQKDAVLALCKQYQKITSEWELDNIFGVINIPIA